MVTSLSAGLAVSEVLTKALGDSVTAVYPVVSEQNARMPYVVYYRLATGSNPDKRGNAFDTCQLAIEVYTAGYAEGVGLMERVRQAVECRRISYTDDDDPTQRMTVDCSLVTDSSEEWAGDSFRQALTIECKITGNKQ